MTERKNINRGYMKLIVWQDAKEYYKLTCKSFCSFPFEFKKIASQQIACVDSIHRNIAEGYCRRSLREYLQFLNVALASAGESVSGLHVYRDAEQITDTQFASLDAIAFKIENGLKRLIESLQQKQLNGTWQDSFVVRESNAAYGTEASPTDSQSQHSTISTFQYSKTARRSRK
jgi:four helix bundle protein